jgi:GGDEF domain-containing protein
VSNLASGTHFEVDPLRAVPNAIEQGLVPSMRDFAALSLVEPAMGVFADVGRMRASRESMERLDSAADAMGQTSVIKLLPPETQAAVGKMIAAGKGAPTTAYVPLNEFIRFAQSQKEPLDAEKLATAINEDGGQSFREAQATGDVAIPLNKYFSKIVASGRHEALKDDVKLDPNEYTPRQARAEEARINKTVQRLIEQYKPGLDDSADRVYSDFFNRAMATGKVPQNVADRNARIVAQTWGNWGRHLRKDPFELYREKADLRIYGPNGEVLDESAHRARAEAQAKAPIELTPENESLLATEPGAEKPEESGMRPLLRDAFEDLTLEQKRRMLFTDPVTGLYNARGFDLLEPDAERPFLTRFSFEGGKAINDFHGHETYDGALRAMARVLEAHGLKDGVKRGGDLEVRTSGPGQEKQLREAMERVLGGKLRVTAGTARIEAPAEATPEARREALEKTLKAVGDAHTAEKDRLVASGEIGHRKGVPAFVAGKLPRIDFDEKGKAEVQAFDEKLAKAQADYDARAEAAKTAENPEQAIAALGPRPAAGDQVHGARPDVESPEMVGKHGLSLESDEAKKALRKAATSKPMRQVVERLRKQAKAEGPEFTEAHKQAFLEHELAGSTFDTIHYTKDGALTDEGFRAARQVLRKAVVVSADARGIRAMNDAFGKEGTDRILSEFTKMLVKYGGRGVDLSHPHGDEFFAQAHSPEVANEFFRSVKRRTDRMVFFRYIKGGTPEQDRIVIQEGVHFAHGLGKSLDEADRVALPEAKRKQGDVRGPESFAVDAGEKRIDELRAAGFQLHDLDEPAAERRQGEGVQGAAASERDRGPLGGRGLPESGPADREGRRDLGGEAGAQGQPEEVAAPDRRERAVAPPTTEELERALRHIDKMKSPEKRQLALEWLAYVRDYDAAEPSPKPKLPGHVMSSGIPRPLEIDLARFGLIDPEVGFRSTEDLQRSRRGGKRKPRGTSNNGALNEYNNRRRAEAEGRGSEATRAELDSTPLKLKQEGPTFRLNSDVDRGYIEFSPGGDGKPRRVNIHVLDGADPSTIAHETFHFLANAMGDVAQDPAAPPHLKDDYQALLKWMGYENGHAQRISEHAEHRALSAKERLTDEEKGRLKKLTAKEERAAVGWEQFLMEGKAPSDELVGTFTRFARWLGQIYGSIKTLGDQFRGRFGEELNLTDEVRGVFNRLLATQQATEQLRARERVANEPFTSALAGMTPEQRAAYFVTQDKARLATEDELYRRLTEEDRKAQRQLVAERKKAIRAEVQRQLLADPAQRALYFFAKGELPESPGNAPVGLKDENGRPYKLDRAELEQRFGKDQVEDIPATAIAKKGAASAPLDGLAALLGFDSGEEMVKALRAAEPFRTLSEAETEYRIRDELGTALVDQGPDVLEQALRASHNDQELQKLVLELRGLRKLAFPNENPRDTLLDKPRAEAVAEDLIRRKTVGDLTGGKEGAAGYFLRAERTARQRAFEAADKGDFNRAHGEAETALLNFVLYRKASELRDELAKATDKLTRSGKDGWRAVLGKADAAYQDAHDAILHAIGLRGEPPASSGPAAIDAFVASAGGNAQGVGFDVEAVKALLAKPKRWKNLSVDEARNVLDAVTNIRHAAVEVNKILLLDRTMSRDEFIEEVQKRLADLPEGPKVLRDKARENWVQRAGGRAQWLDAILTDTETRIRMLTRGDTSHPLYKLFVEGYLKARNAKEDLARQFLSRILAKWEQLPKEMRERMGDTVDLAGRLDLPEDVAKLVSADGKITRSQLIMIALNMGNEGNEERLLGGYGWTRPQVMDVLTKELSAAEWKWVQNVWDSLEELYPLIEKLEFEETGLRPGKVKATPITLPDGTTLRGGYFPARYDPRIPSLGVEQVEGAIARFFDPAYKRATTVKSHAKARAEHYQDVVNLDWDVVPAHVGQVLHDLAFRRYVKDAASILVDKRMQVTLQQYLGRESALQLDPWLKTVANAQADAVPANLATGQKIISGIRNRTAMQALGYNLPVALGDFSNLAVAPAIGKVDVKPMSKALAKSYGHWGEVRSWALQQSPELRHRADRISRALAHDLGAMGAAKKGGLIEGIRESAFVFMEWSDRATATPIWVGRYDQALGEGLSHEEAVARADDVVRQLFPPEDIAEASPLTRDRRGLGSLVMFYGYMNKLYNLQRGWVRDLRLAFHDNEGWGARAGAVAQITGKVLALGLTAGAMSELLAGRGKEQDESWGGWLLRKTLTLPFYTVPLMGPLVDAVVFQRRASQRLTPGVNFIQHSMDTVGRLVKHPSNEKALTDALSLIGFGVNLPMRPATVTGKYGFDAAAGRVPVRGPGDVVGGAVYGQHEKQPANLPTAIQGAVSGR